MRNYEIVLHVTAPDDLDLSDYPGVCFLSKADVTFYRESITELEPEGYETVYDIADGYLGCPCCTGHNTRQVGKTEPKWICLDDDVKFETAEGIMP